MRDKPFRHLSPGGVSHRKVTLARSGEERHIASSLEIGPAGFDPRSGFMLFHDFEFPASGTLPAWLAKQDTSSGGTPTLDYVANADGGEYTLAHDNTDEVQNITLYGGDQLTIDITKKPILIARAKLNIGGATLSADQRFVIGLASARNATLDNVATHAWFRMEGASLNVLWESDDGTTDDNDNDTGVDFVDDTYLTFKIDAADLATVKFYIDQEAGAGFVLVGTADMSDATGNLQFFAELQKDAGTETDAAVFDYVQIFCIR